MVCLAYARRWVYSTALCRWARYQMRFCTPRAIAKSEQFEPAPVKPALSNQLDTYPALGALFATSCEWKRVWPGTLCHEPTNHPEPVVPHSRSSTEFARAGKVLRIHGPVDDRSSRAIRDPREASRLALNMCAEPLMLLPHIWH